MKLLGRSFIPHSLFILLVFLLIAVYLIPLEESLGHIIKGVFIHAALVQTGLILFTCAGVFGLVSLFLKKELFPNLTLATQKTAVLIWTLYIISSMIVTYLAWGVAIAWEEPRVRSSAEVWLLSLLFMALVLWIKNSKFTAVTNVILAIATWILIKSAGMIRHPLDPIGSSEVSLYKILFITVFGLVVLIALQIMRLFYKK